MDRRWNLRSLLLCPARGAYFNKDGEPHPVLSPSIRSACFMTGTERKYGVEL